MYRRQTESRTRTVMCSAGSCQVQPPKAVGERCVNDAGCLAGARCTRGICGGEGGYCADASACQSGCKWAGWPRRARVAPSSTIAHSRSVLPVSCSRNKCSSLMPAGLGESCSIDDQCPRVSTGQVACKDGRCGGYGAACITVDGKFPGSSPQCRADCESECDRGDSSTRRRQAAYAHRFKRYLPRRVLFASSSCSPWRSLRGGCRVSKRRTVLSEYVRRPWKCLQGE